jgi:hypothetical protein
VESYRRNCSRLCICYGAAPTSQVSGFPSLFVSWEQELISRGPHEERWFGWRGGWELLKRPAMVDLSPEALTEGPLHHERGGDGRSGVVATSGARDREAVGGVGGKIGTRLDPARA